MKTVLTLNLLCFAFLNNISNAQVRVDYDKETDFSKYKTIQFIGWQEDSDQMLNDLEKKRIYDAFINEFTKKEYELVEEDGDLLLTFFIVIDQKTSRTAHTNYMGGYGYGDYYYGDWGWGGGMSTTNYTESDYYVGTFVVDFFDRQEKKLVWEGVKSGTISENPKAEERRIPKDVAKLLKKFPPKP